MIKHIKDEKNISYVAIVSDGDCEECDFQQSNKADHCIDNQCEFFAYSVIYKSVMGGLVCVGEFDDDKENRV